MVYDHDRWHRHSLRRCMTELRMSKDPNTKVGAVIVGPDNEVRSTGFNGLPRGIRDTDERLGNRDIKLPLTVHAERNAILNAARIGVSTKGCTLYQVAIDEHFIPWGGPPCTACTIEIIQAGITQVVSYPFKNVPSKWRDDIEYARGLLVEAGVGYKEVPPSLDDLYLEERMKQIRFILDSVDLRCNVAGQPVTPINQEITYNELRHIRGLTDNIYPEV